MIPHNKRPNFPLKRLSLGLALAPVALPHAWAQALPDAASPAVAAAAAEQVAAPASNVFTLGTVEVIGTHDGELGASDTSTLTSAQMNALNANTLAEAGRHIPGVNLTSNSRNELMLNVRGFDSRQVPVYVDGIPLYVPYDGYVDFARFTTFNLSQVRVAKAGASLLYGPNTLGGAVNLVTRQPVKPFEGDVQIGFASGAEKKAAINLGGKQENWYYQLGASYLSANSFPLPKGFHDYKKKPTDTGNYRENASRTDKHLSFKVGLTPNTTDEYALAYVWQKGEKGNPVYTGQSTQRNATRFWDWPYWDKSSLYFLSTTRIGEHNLLKTKLFHDTYKNGLDMYTDGRYTSHAPTSAYKDESNGASLEWSNFALPGHDIVLALHYKEDKHHDIGTQTDPDKRYRDVTTSVVLQDSISLADRWLLTASVSHDRRSAKTVYQYPTGSTNATNGLLKLSYALNTSSENPAEVYGLVSHKTRFPTIKDRYSARMGRALPNPDLKPEAANHFEVGFNGSPWNGGQGQAAVFYSRIRDLIQTQTVPSLACQGTLCDQAQNIGRAKSMGFELSLTQKIATDWQAGLGYTYLKRTNLSDRSDKLKDTPKQRLISHLQWQAISQWSLRAEVEAETGRYGAVGVGTKSATQELGGFGIVNLRTRYQPTTNTTVDLGVTNLGDKWYQFSDGYPMAGRGYYINLGYRF